VSAPASIGARPQGTPTADEVTKDASPGVQGDEAHVIAAAGIASESRGADPALASAPPWDEEPLLIAEDEPSAAMNRTAGTPAR
jgi:hypothetical protein